MNDERSGEGDHPGDQFEGESPEGDGYDDEGEHFDEDGEVIIPEISSTESHLKAMAMMARESILTKIARVIIPEISSTEVTRR